MKDLEQLRKDYEQMGRTIVKLENPKNLTFTDLKIGDHYTLKYQAEVGADGRVKAYRRIKVSATHYVWFEVEVGEIGLIDGYTHAAVVRIDSKGFLKFESEGKLEQLKKDYKVLGETIAEMKKLKPLVMGALKAGSLFRVTHRSYHQGVRLIDDGGGYVFIHGGSRGKVFPTMSDLEVFLCDRDGHPLPETR